MRLEYALTVCDPRSLMVADIQSSTSNSSGLTKADIMTALGYVQRQEHAGLALLYAKYLKHDNEISYALDALWQYSQAKHASSNIKGRAIMRQLVALALFDYCRTPEDKDQQCPACKGRKEVRDRKAEQQLYEICSKMVELTKPCKRCHGTGLKALPKSNVVTIVQKMMPKLSQATIYRIWIPIYNELVQWCYTQEEEASRSYSRMVRM